MARSASSSPRLRASSGAGMLSGQRQAPRPRALDLAPHRSVSTAMTPHVSPLPASFLFVGSRGHALHGPRGSEVSGRGESE
jgi:hypothetical protein